MHGDPKRIRSCPTHTGRGTRYRPQPLSHPTLFATNPVSSPANPTHTDSQKLPRNPDILDHTPPALARPSHEIGVEPTSTPNSRYSSRTLHQGHLTYYLYALQDGPTNGTHHQATQDNRWVAYCGNDPPSDTRLAAVPQTAQHSVHTAPPTHSSHHTTLPRCSDQPASPTITLTAHAHSPPPGPYAPNRTTPTSGARAVCANLRSLGTGRGPGQPGLARPPAPPDHNPEGDTPRRRASTPQIRLAGHPQDQPSELQRTTRNSSPTPELAGTHLT